MVDNVGDAQAFRNPAGDCKITDDRLPPDVIWNRILFSSTLPSLKLTKAVPIVLAPLSMNFLKL